MERIKVTTTVDKDLLALFKKHHVKGETLGRLLDVAIEEHMVPDLRPQSIAMAFSAGYNEAIKDMKRATTK